MLFRTIEPGAWHRPGRLVHTPWVAAPRRPELAERYDTAALAGDLGRQVLILRTLIEEFGGEATGDSLCRRLIEQFPALRRNPAQSRLWIRVELNELAGGGALLLEDVDGTEVIARITEDGADFAYDPPAADVTSNAA